MKKFSIHDIEMAFEHANFGNILDNRAALNPKTGEIHLLGDNDDDFLPEDFDEEDEALVWLPDKRDLDLGQRLVMDFAREYCPENFEEVYFMFHHRGAYRAFKGFLARKQLLDAWYAFETEKTRQALLDWCLIRNIKVDVKTSKVSDEE